MIGKRDNNHYGELTLENINDLIISENNNHFELEFYQSNYEGDIITKIQQSLDCYGIIINPAAYTHTSVGIRDALDIFSGIKVEVHLSHVDEREDFRKINFVRDVCNVCFSGKKEQSYVEAIRYLKNIK